MTTSNLSPLCRRVAVVAPLTVLRLIALFAFAATGFAASPRVVKTINRDWTFEYFPQPTPSLAPTAPGYDDSHWQAIALPHTWSTFETTREVHPFIHDASETDDSYWWYGWGWYRKRIDLGRELAGRRISLVFDGVQTLARVYVNGVFVGEHKGGYTGFSIDITPQVRLGAENVVAVQVSDRRNRGAGHEIPPSTAGNFDVYGGIYRDVRLVVTDPLHVPYQGSAEHEGGTFVTTPEVSAARGTVRVRTWVRNDFPTARRTTLVTTVKDADGRTVLTATAEATIAPGELHAFDQAVGEVARPHLWSPSSPYLYEVDTAVRDGARLADTYHSPLGFRWFRWDHATHRLYLNGQMILLHGSNRHQEYPWLGDAMPKWMHRKDLEDMRYNMGLNFQRTVHYPNDPFVYDECDRLGFMLIEEACAIKDIKFDRAVQKQFVQEMIRRDRNHPSILMWSMGNETNQPADSAWAKAEDPTRIIYLRRADNGGNYVDLTDKELPIENLLRCTVRGWLNEDDHDFGAQTGHPASGQVTGTEDWQYEKTLHSPRLNTGNVVTWLYADHGADRHYLDSPLLHINPKGWVDAYRFPKLAYYIWLANYGTKPMAFIHPTWWRPQYIGQHRDIIVDSNCDEIELKLDGRSLGRQRPTPENGHSVIFPDVLVGRGTLTADGFRNGVPVHAALTMAGSPARLVLTTAQRQITADRAGIAVCALDIVDANGVHVYGAHPPLTWTVTGPATLVGPSLYVTDTNKNGSMDGTMYIDAPVANLVRSTDQPGVIRVEVSAPGFAPVAVTITSVAPASDVVAGITEPALADDGREPVRRDPAFKAVVVKGKTNKIAEITDDQRFDTADPEKLRREIGAFIQKRNPNLDVFSASYRAFLERMVVIVSERNGLMIADDYNFNARALNQAKAKKKKP